MSTHCWLCLPFLFLAAALFADGPGANVPDKPRRFMVYVGGQAIYNSRIQDVAQENYPGFRFN